MKNYCELILSVENIKKYCQKFKIRFEGKGKIFTVVCPFCGQFTAGNVSQTHLIHCIYPKCEHKGEKFSLVAIVRKTEPDKKDWEREKIIVYIKKLFNINNILTAKDEEDIAKVFEDYKKYGFSLVPIRPNDKIPIESEWQIKEHKDSTEWKEWINSFLNIGVNCKLSKVTIIDIDQKPIPEAIQKVMGETLIQESSKGFHLVYQVEEDMPKTRIDSLKIDIETGNGQVVIYPSIINGIQRKWINHNPIIKMPQELKDFLTKFITVKDLKSNSEKTKEAILDETYQKVLLTEGDGRNDYLFHLGCILRKQLSLTDTEVALSVINKISCSPQLPYNEIRSIVNTISNYNVFDEKELANRVLEHLNIVKEATRKDIERTIYGDIRLKAEDKQRLDKVIAYLRKEDYIQQKRNLLFPIRKMEWSNSLIDCSKAIQFKMPYFYDLGHFADGDLIIIGAKTGVGKTHIAMNIVKQLVDQNVKPYYINLETGSRFAKIALQIGLTENQFLYNKQYYNPMEVEFEKNAITILDWLNPTEFKDTHLIFEHLSKQLSKNKGVLIVFVQLKEDGSFFAPNLINHFSALSTKYLYDETSDGVSGYFEICKIRESILKTRQIKIPCVYNWITKLLTRVDDNRTEMITEERISTGNAEEK